MNPSIPILALIAVASCAFAENADPKQPAAAPVKNVTPDEVEKLLKERKDVVVLDVRTPDEFAAGHLAGAQNVDFFDKDFEKNAGAFAGKSVVVHCASGRRSAQAVELLKRKTFPEIFHLNGGFKAWVDAGKPVAK